MNKKVKKIITSAVALSMAFAAYPAAGHNPFSIVKEDITVSAYQQYPCGTYAIYTNNFVYACAQPNFNSRINLVRTGSRFYVERVFGNWGYSSRIITPNGLVRGWVYLPDATFLIGCRL